MKVNFIFREAPKDEQHKVLVLEKKWSIAKVKGIVRQEYKINKLYTIQLLLDGKPLHPKKILQDVLKDGAEVQVLAINEEEF